MSTIYDTVRHICLSLPETDEIISHGSPNFRVRNKSFAIYSVNHHGDNKVAMLINVAAEFQQMLVTSAPNYFFVPPYVGHKGWVGIELNHDLAWQRISDLSFAAYQRTAPKTLASKCSPTVTTGPSEIMTAEQINPMLSDANQSILGPIQALCLGLPEVTSDLQFGNPCFRAGKKSFATVHLRNSRTYLQIWVGLDQQVQLTSFDRRFSVPPYVGHNGWVDLDVTDKQNQEEIKKLVEASYRHFALKRMLKILDAY
jgi:hypothetical protein